MQGADLAAVEAQALRQAGQLVDHDDDLFPAGMPVARRSTSAVLAIGGLGIVDCHRRLPTWWIPARL